MLRSKIYEFELEKKREVTKKLRIRKLDIDFGSQIRSYVLQPYRMIKDHRTKLEIGDVDRVIDGDLRPLMQAIYGCGGREKGVSRAVLKPPALGSRLQRAFRYAAEKHAGQTRKQTAVPYLSHLMAWRRWCWKRAATKTWRLPRCCMM